MSATDLDSDGDLDSLDAVFGYVVGDFARLEAQQRYRSDPARWAQDKLGLIFHEKQIEVGNALVEHRNVAVAAGHGTGKAATLDTKIPTPTGWTTFGEVKVGDEVLSEHGEPVRVSWKSPEWNLDRYRVVFDDGSTVEVNGAHEWQAIDVNGRREGVRDWRENWDASKTVETRFMYENLTTPSKQRRWRIPTAKPLAMPDAELPVEPYTLGAWLGDGTSTTAQITTHPDDVQIIRRIEQDGYATAKLTAPYLWSLGGNDLRAKLREAGVFNNKHIPMAYLRASYGQRLEVLRGLMDTDGTIDERGLVEFSVTSWELANSFRELVHTMGWKTTMKISSAMLNGAEHGLRYRLHFRADVNPFHLARKAERWREPGAQASRHTLRTVVRIDRLTPAPTVCIEVESDTHLFLVGNFIPTHNSFQAAILACWWVDTHPLGTAYVATTAPTNDQISEIIFREVKRIHAISAERVAKGLIKPEEGLQGRVGEDNTWKIERAGRLVTVMKGRKPPDNKAGDAFQGLHARYVLAIGDEATGLSEEMIDGLANITSNDNSRRLLISNPTNPYSALGRIFLKPAIKEDGTEAWKKIHVSVFDLPTFHGGGKCECPRHKGLPLGLRYPKELLESISGPQYVKDKKAEYGEDSARYKARVMGQFAFEAGSNLFTDREINTTIDTVVQPDVNERPVLGVDVARFGEDKSVVYRVDEGVVYRRSWAEGVEDGSEEREMALDDNGLPVKGWKLRYMDSWSGAPLVNKMLPDGTHEMGTAERVHEHAMSIGAKSVRVDASGLGGGVADRLWDLSKGGKLYEVVEVLGGAASPDRRKHYNNRAFQFDSMRLRMFQGRIDIDARDEQLLDELSGIQYEFADAASGGGLKIESKEAMRRKGRKSPDFADAAWYALIDMSDVSGLLPGEVIHSDMSEMVGHERDWFYNAPAGTF